MYCQRHKDGRLSQNLRPEEENVRFWLLMSIVINTKIHDLSFTFGGGSSHVKSQKYKCYIKHDF